MADKEQQDGKLSAKGLKCLFSGKPTLTEKARFLPGYDAKMKGLLLKIIRGQAELSAVRKDAIPFLQSKEGLVGFRLKGGKLEHIGKFKIAADAPKKKAKHASPAIKKGKVKIKKPKLAVVAAGATEDEGDGEEEGE